MVCCKEKEQITSEAIPLGRKLMQEGRKRGEELAKQKIKDRILEAREALQTKDDRGRNRTEHVFSQVSEHGGLWADPEQLENMTGNLSKTKARAAIKCLIQFRKTILKCTVLSL